MLGRHLRDAAYSKQRLRVLQGDLDSGVFSQAAYISRIVFVCHKYELISHIYTEIKRVWLFAREKQESHSFSYAPIRGPPVRFLNQKIKNRNRRAKR